MLTDCGKKDNTLRTRDKDFAEAYAKALSKVTGKEYLTRKRIRVVNCFNRVYSNNWYVVPVRLSWINYIVKSKLWKVIAYIYPREFLRGLFDGDGSVCITASSYFRILITLCMQNNEVISLANKLLHSIGIKTRKYRYDLSRICICQEECKKFGELVGFKIGRKQEKLNDALYILQKYGKGKNAIQKWKKLYTKANGNWIKRGQA